MGFGEGEERGDGVPGTATIVRNIHLFISRYLFDAHIVPATVLGSGILQ